MGVPVNEYELAGFSAELQDSLGVHVHDGSVFLGCGLLALLPRLLGECPPFL